MRPRAFLLASVPAPACGLFLPHFGHFALQTALPPATSSRYAEPSRIGPMTTGATMAALFTTPKRNDTTAGTHVAEPDVRRRIGLAHGSWRRVTRRIVVGAVCALTVSSLLMPSVSLAAEWVKVGETKYNAGTAAGDETGTWSWDGADDLKLNNYNGGEIQAAGKLNVNYSGNNIVTADWIEGIKASHGKNENAKLNIQGDAGSTLSVTSTEDAILSTGNINIDDQDPSTPRALGLMPSTPRAISLSKVRATSTPRAYRMASGQTAISRLTTAGPSPPGLPRTRVSEPTRTSPSRVAAQSRQAQPMVRPFGAAATSISRTAARSRRAPRKTPPSRPRAASQPQTPPSTQTVLNMASMPTRASHSIMQT